MSNEEVQIDNAKKMLQWVTEHDNRIPSTHAKDEEEKEVGKWWSGAKTPQKNYVEKYADVKASLFGETVAQKAIESDYNRTIAARTISKEEVQVDNSHKMLQWVEEHDNMIPRPWATKGTGERVIGQWWKIAKSTRSNYVEKYPSVKATLFGETISQKAIEADYNRTIAVRTTMTIRKEEVHVNNANKMLTWVTEHDNRIPSQYAKDNEEKEVGKWWSCARSQNFIERQACVKTVLFGGDSTAQKAIESDYKKTIEVNHAKKMLQWVTEHDNKIPSHNAKDKEEKTLGQWWNDAKSTQGNNVEKYTDVKTVLFGGDSAAHKKIEADYKKIEADYKKTIVARTTIVDNSHKMLQWVEEHDNRIPRPWATKGTEERVIGQWWNNAKSTQGNYVEKYPDIKIVLFDGDSEAHKTIEADYNRTIAARTTMSKEEVQVNNANKMLAWVTEHDNRIPSTYATKGTEERVLGNWWSSAKSPQKNYVEKYADVKAALFGGDSAAHKKIEADYKKTIEGRTISKEEVQVDNSQKMLQWVTEHDNKIPSQSAKDKEEKALGVWWMSAKSSQNNYVEKYAGVKAVLFGGDSAAHKKIEADYKKTIEGRTMSNEEVQVNHAKKMLQWVEEHDNRIPSSIAKDKEEKALGIWWNHAKSPSQNYVERYAGVKTVLFGGDNAAQKTIEADYNRTIAARTTMSKEEVQVNNANKMLTWVTEHDNRIPSTRAKDKEEKEVGSWWSSTKSPQGNYVEKYAGVKAVLFGGDSAAHKKIETDYKKTIASRTISNEEVQVNHAKKMLQWVEEHDNRIPRSCAKDKKEKALGVWWNRAKSTQNNYVKKYAGVKAVLFGGDTAAQKAIEADYNRTIAARTTMSKEEVQVDNAKKMLAWVIEHNNRIPSRSVKEKEEIALGVWWNRAKSTQGNYVEKYPGVKTVLFGETEAQKVIEVHYKETVRKRGVKQHLDNVERTAVDQVSPLLKKRKTIS
jgi:hypothetical protein